MPVTVVLAVGLDPWLLSAKSTSWKAHGYVVIPVATAREAIDYFKAGDFDLVLLGSAITAEKKEQLTSLIRAFSKRTPVMCVNRGSAPQEEFADPPLNDPGKVIAGLKEFLATESGLCAGPFVA